MGGYNFKTTENKKYFIVCLQGEYMNLSSLQWPNNCKQYTTTTHYFNNQNKITLLSAWTTILDQRREGFFQQRYPIDEEDILRS